MQSESVRGDGSHKYTKCNYKYKYKYKYKYLPLGLCRVRVSERTLTNTPTDIWGYKYRLNTYRNTDTHENVNTVKNTTSDIENE